MNIPLTPILCDVLHPHMGKELTPQLLVQINYDLMSKVYPGLIDISTIPHKQVGRYTLMPERAAVMCQEMKEHHQRHWGETEKHRHDVDFNPDYGRVMELDYQGRYLTLVVRETETGVMVGNYAFVLEKCAQTQLPSAYEDVLYLAPEVRRGRLGVAFIKYGEEVLKHLGVRDVTVSAKTITKLGPMLQRLGYEQVGALHNKRL